MITHSIQYIKYDHCDIKEICDTEVWRYAGYQGMPAPSERELLAALEEVKKTASQEINGQICYCIQDLSWEKDKPILPFPCQSADLAKCLEGCEHVVFFAATIGIGIDRLIRRSQHGALTKALLFQALGTERIEALCDTFCHQLARQLHKDECCITPRFSPGYGDLPLAVQKDLVPMLDCYRKIGISLNDSLLMTPSKSVTAIMGIRKTLPSEQAVAQGEKVRHKCAYCEKKDCSFRGRKEEPFSKIEEGEKQ